MNVRLATEELLAESIDRRAEDEIAGILAGLRGHRAVSSDGIEVVRLVIRELLKERRQSTGLRIIDGGVEL